jgi:dTDP-4-dehydrorhamnose reductase
VKFLVTGAGGLLGAHLAAALSADHDVTGTDRHPWWGDRDIAFMQGDLGTPGFIEATVQAVRPDVMIHCAGLVNVDRCEEEPALAYATNAEVTGRLARLTAPSGLFVYITTDGIFKGDCSFATEAWLPCPRTVYGRSKLQGEWETQIATPNNLIIRSNFYGWSSGRKASAAEWLFQALEQGLPLTLFQDFYFTPLYVVDLVERILALVAADRRGIFHVGGRDRVSKYDFGLRLAAAAHLPTLGVRAGSIAEASLRAARPRDMSLDSSRLLQATGLAPPDCGEGLRRFVADRFRPLSARFGSHKSKVPHL